MASFKPEMQKQSKLFLVFHVIIKQIQWIFQKAPRRTHDLDAIQYFQFEIYMPESTVRETGGRQSLQTHTSIAFFLFCSKSLRHFK